MRNFVKLTLGCIACLPAFNSFAIADYYAQKNSQNSESIAKYLLNFGAYFGYDLTKAPNQGGGAASQNLLNAPEVQLLQTFLLYNVLGAMPVSTVSQALTEFVPSKSSAGSILNPFANLTFKGQNYNSPSQQGGTISVSPLVDQKSYQQDPVSQGVLNILTTPDQSYCMSYDGSQWNDKCELLFQNKVTSNAIGTLPATNVYYTFDYVKQYLGQLNSNTLLSPMLYSTEPPEQDNNQSNSNNQTPGLQAQSQAQQALNFVRYASGSLLLPDLPRMKDYDNLYMQAMTNSNNVPMAKRIDAYTRLTRYLTGLRTYAAQTSVGLSNLYYILSKRLPQKQGTGESKPMSQALSEFNMATWRLFNPDMSSNAQWLKRINDASPATVQKEIAILLSEMNYQLYLNRQQEERLLLTNSLLLLQNTKANQPNADFYSQGSSSATPQ